MDAAVLQQVINPPLHYSGGDSKAERSLACIFCSANRKGVRQSELFLSQSGNFYLGLL